MKSTNGVERVLTQRLSLLAESGEYEVYLITYNQYGAPFSFPISEKVHYIDLATRYIGQCSCRGLFQYFDRFFSKLFYRWTVHKCLKQINPDVISCIDVYLADLTAVLACEIDAVKVVECHCGLSAYFGGLAKVKSQSKRVVELKNKEKIVQTICKFDKIIVMTEEENKDWVSDSKVVCIPNMLPYYPLDSPDRTQTYHRVISVGRYAYQKGFDMLLNSWKYVHEHHPEWQLHIYGSHDGDTGDYDQLKSVVDKNLTRSVCLHPATNDIYSEYCKSDFYVLSSRFESFGLVLIEAMSCGLPVVAFDCKYGPGSIVNDGDTGILVPPLDVQKLAQSICYMIEHADERIRMGRNARTAVLPYKAERVMSIWHCFYQSVLCSNA